MNQPKFIKEYKTGYVTATKGNLSPLLGLDTLQVLYTTGEEGSLVNYINIQPLGTNIACIVRIFLNNGQDYQIATNNALLREVAIAATTQHATNALPNQLLPVMYKLADNQRLLVNLSTTIASGLSITAFGGDY